MANGTATPNLGTGIPALDDILGGGLTPNRMYLVSGNPGSGKTTLGLQFLLEGRARGEVGLYVTLSETEEELAAVAATHGWSLDGLHIYELPHPDVAADDEGPYTMFHPSEVELSETTRAILERVEEVRPSRIVFDSLSEMRLLAQNPLRYRRQILALKQFFVGRGVTFLLLDDRTSEEGDAHLQSLAHAVLTLETMSPSYGRERRRLRVEKFRGRAFRGGFHDYRIVRGGLDVFPRLVAAEHRADVRPTVFPTGVPALDRMLGGGFESGTSTLIMGPAGSGKTTLAIRCAWQAIERGGRARLFLFDEGPATLMARSAQLGMPLDPHVASGRISLQQVDPAELSPGEFAHLVRHAVEGDATTPGVDVVVIDTLNGYMHAMPEESLLLVQMHELLSYLRQKGVLTFLVMAQAGLVGSVQSPVDASYLADGILLLRFFEAHGQVRQALSVLKKRTGAHEHTIREFRLGPGGIELGEPLTEFQGVLAGVPTFVGPDGHLLGKPVGEP